MENCDVPQGQFRLMHATKVEPNPGMKRRRDAANKPILWLLETHHGSYF
jgi:hypothetical protein